VLTSMMEDSTNSIFNVLRSIEPIDFLDIALLTVVIYAAIKLLRETRAGQLVKGLILLACIYAVSTMARLKALSWLSDNALKAGAIAIVILFQPELRRILERFGRTASRLTIMTVGEKDDIIKNWEIAIPNICHAVEQLHKTKTGALIVIERSSKLGELLNESSTELNAIPSVELFCNIFYPNTPLHDGALIMRDGLIWAAGVHLPMPQKDGRIAKGLGTRHRAAIGMSETSDALVIVVSEETGQISVAENGGMRRDYTGAELEELLTQRLITPSKDSLRSKIRAHRQSFPLPTKIEPADQPDPLEKEE